MGDAAKQHPRPLISAIDGLDLNRTMNDSDLYVICICLDSIKAVCAEINGRIDCSASARKDPESGWCTLETAQINPPLKFIQIAVTNLFIFFESILIRLPRSWL